MLSGMDYTDNRNIEDLNKNIKNLNLKESKNNVSMCRCMSRANPYSAGFLPVFSILSILYLFNKVGLYVVNKRREFVNC